ncbi:MAG: hypothetical protein V4760_07905, partial [Bdellovibrionota bacterium]
TPDEFLSLIVDNGLNDLEIELLRQDENVKDVLKKIGSTELIELLESSPRLVSILEGGHNIFVLPEMRASLRRSVRKQIKELSTLSPSEALDQIGRFKRSFSRFGIDGALDKALVPVIKTIIPRQFESIARDGGSPQQKMSSLIDFANRYGEDPFLRDALLEACREYAKTIAAEIVETELGKNLGALQVLDRAVELVERYDRGMDRSAMFEALRPSVKKATEQYLKHQFLAEKDPSRIVDGVRLVNLANPNEEFFVMRFTTDAHSKHVSQALASLKLSLPKLTRAQLVDPRNPHGAVAFAGRHHTLITNGMKDDFRKTFLSSIPSYFASMSDKDVQDVLLEAERNQSRIGWFAAHFELHRRLKSGVMANLTYQINSYSSFGTDGFTSDIFDAMGNVHPKKPLPLDFMKRWLLQGTSGSERHLLERMWKFHPFDEARDLRFVKAMSATDKGMITMLYAISDGLVSTQGNRKILPPKWTAFDTLIEKFIVDAPLATLRSYGEYLIYPWLGRAAQIDSRKVSPVALVKIHDIVGRPVPHGTNDWIHHVELHEAIAKYPQLIEHPRAGEIIEVMVGHRNFANGDAFDVQLRTMIETHWKAHPRASVWLHALTLPRMNRANVGGVIERETYLGKIPMQEFIPRAVAPPSGGPPKASAVAQPKPRPRPAQCRALFAS